MGGKVGAPENAVYVAYTHRDLCSLPFKERVETQTDAARFIFLTRRCDSPLDFDLKLAKSAADGPLF